MHSPLDSVRENIMFFRLSVRPSVFLSRKILFIAWITGGTGGFPPPTAIVDPHVIQGVEISVSSPHCFFLCLTTDLVITISHERLEQSRWNLQAITTCLYWWPGLIKGQGHSRPSIWRRYPRLRCGIEVHLVLSLCFLIISVVIDLYLLWTNPLHIRCRVTVLRCWRSACRASCVQRSAPVSKWASPACHSAPKMKGRFWLAVKAAGFSAVQRKPEEHMPQVNKILAYYFVLHGGLAVGRWTCNLQVPSLIPGRSAFT